MTNRRSTPQDPVPADEAARAPVTRQAVLNDLRWMILAAADHIGLLGPKGDALTAFLGFDAGRWNLSTGAELGPERVDLDRYAFTGVVNRAYDFAWQVGPRKHRQSFDTDDMYLTETYLRTAFQLTAGQFAAYQIHDDSALEQTLKAARARWMLDGGFLTIEELALLARMTVPAVRASLSKEGIRTSGAKNEAGYSSVVSEDALAWLLGRRGFVPTETALPQDLACVDDDVAEIFRTHGWEGLVVDQTRILGLGTLAQAEGIDPDWLMDLVADRPTVLDLAALERVGRIVARDLPRFVGFGIERLMRAQSRGKPRA